MPPIWFRDFQLEEINARGKSTLVEHLGIVVTELGDEYLVGTMPVDARTKQPVGLLHGGASVALAESLCSIAGNLVVNSSEQYCVGLEINANHISPSRGGTVRGVARPVHLGKSTQVWETKIEQDGKLICISRMTLAILRRPPARSGGNA